VGNGLKKQRFKRLTQLIEQLSENQNPDGFKRESGKNCTPLLSVSQKVGTSLYPTTKSWAVYNGSSVKQQTGTFSQWFWVVLLSYGRLLQV
jgi:hypothetical protein